MKKVTLYDFCITFKINFNSLSKKLKNDSYAGISEHISIFMKFIYFFAGNILNKNK